MRVLIIRFSSMGDIILTSPVIRSFARQLGAEIDVLTKPAFAPLYQHNPYVRKCFVHRSGFLQTGALRKQQYDLVADLHNNLRSRIYTWMLMRPVKRFHKANLAKWMAVRTKNLNNLPDGHLVHRYFDSLASEGIHYDQQGLDFFFPPDFDGASAAPVMTRMDKQPYLVLALGGTYYTKRIPAETAASIVKHMQHPVVLVGGDDCLEVAGALEKQYPDQIVNTTGKFNIFETAWMVNGASAVISGDSVVMHMAAALKKPLLTLWGNTVPQFGMYPLYPEGMDINLNFEVQNLPCRPCSKLGKSYCPAKHFKCMLQQDGGRIALNAEQFI